MSSLEFTPTPDPASPTRVYIPADLQDCFRELDSLLPASEIKSIRACEERDLGSFHIGLGMRMRNNWRMWSYGSRLKKHFDCLGGLDPDSASALIVESY